MSRIAIEMLLKNQIEALKLQNQRDRKQWKHDIKQQHKIIRQLRKELGTHHRTIKWIASQQDLFFAECSQAEEIVARCKLLL